MKTIRICASLLALAFLIPAAGVSANETPETDGPVKWVDFNVPARLMKKAIELDAESQSAEARLCWIDMLAYFGAKNGGAFKKVKTSDLDGLAETLRSGQTMGELTEKLGQYGYFRKAYGAVLNGLVGAYEAGTEQPDGSIAWEPRYGLRAYAPLAKGYDFSHFDDFGDRRSYGYRRRHLGHDLMALTGTPIIAAESGIVEELGWNRYGGWRVGIRSFDGLRYWYYAHMRQNRPYAEGLTEGQTVTAGDVIGYVGRTGYSTNENKNNIKQSHLHWGLQLIFDESQKDGDNQIWIDLYEITKLLLSRRSETVRNPETKEHTRADLYREADHPGAPRHPSGAGDEAFRKADPRETVSLPVIMYHDILKSRKNRYTITPDAFESDLKWLCENGWQTVGVQDIIDYVEKGAALPEKPVMLTFDDGYYNNLFYADPLLEQYQMKAVIFVVGDYTDKAVMEGVKKQHSSYILWDDQRRMAESGRWEIQNHSYHLHRIKGGVRGVSRLRGEDDEAYRARLRDDFQKLDDKIETVTGVRPQAFAYPFGHLAEMAEASLRDAGHKASFTSCDGIALLRMGDPESLRLIQRRLRAPGKGVKAFVE